MIEYPLTKMNASAGSGKTYALTNQFVDLLFASDLAPCESCKPAANKKKYNFSELLAITFTNLAANQMKEKVIQILKQYAFKEIPCASEEEKEEKSKQAHAMLESIFRQYGALNIRTIDSLLNQILGLFALELGYSPHFKASFGSRDCIDELYARLAEESLANEESMESGTINYAPVFHELCKNVFDSDNYDTFFAKPSVKERLIKLIEYSITHNHYFVFDEIREAEQNYAFFRQEKEKCATIIKSNLESLQNLIESDGIAVNAFFKKALKNAFDGDFSSATLKKENFSQVLLKGNKADTDEASYLYEELKKNIAKAGEAQFLSDSFRLNLPLMKLSRVINLALTLYEQEEQRVNTQKMPHIIAWLLGKEECGLQSDFLVQKKEEEQLVSAAFCRLGTRLKHILYDEFQDTSKAQWKALKDLSAEALANGGSVLFVGDVKQAIYGWRGGDSSLFHNAPKELIPYAGKLNEGNLAYNWRSAGNIIQWNNVFFKSLLDLDKGNALELLLPNSAKEGSSETLFAEMKESLKADYEFIEQKIPESRREKTEGEGLVEVHFLPGEDYFDIAALALLPEMVRNLYEKHKEYGKIAILTVKNEQASRVSQVLLSHGIPVVSQGSLGLKEHPVIVEMMAFLRFLANPLDDGAFCQVLLSRHIFPEDFYSAFPAEEVWNFLIAERKGACFNAFREKYPLLWQTYFHVLVDGASLLTAYDTLCELYERMAVLERNPDASLYLLRLKELAYLAEENGIVDINAFLSWWEENGDEEKAPLPEGLNSVSVLTIHKSKGLEYDAVIVPWHDFRIAVPDNVQKMSIPYGGKTYTVYSALNKECAERYEQALLEKVKESINDTYVAWTRAKSELHIFMPAVCREKTERNFYRFMGALLHELEKSPEMELDKNENLLRFGKQSDFPIISEESLQLAKYALFGDETYEGLQENKKQAVDLLLAGYMVKNGGGDDLKLRILADDAFHVAKKLSHILCPFRKEKEKERETKAKPKETVDYEHSMGWLPQLRIFRSDLEEVQGHKKLSANKRGTLIHKSLEYLVLSGNIAEDCKRAVYEAMKYLPFGRFLDSGGQNIVSGNASQYEVLYDEVQKDLRWFASLEEPFGGAALWFKYGYKEHGIADEKGSLFRVDLLVEIPERLRGEYQDIAYIAVDYKTGYAGEDLPIKSNREQILNYVELLAKATGKKAVGLLVYLDVRKCCIVESE